MPDERVIPSNANDDAQLASSLMFFAATMKDRDIAACMEKAAARISHVVSESGTNLPDDVRKLLWEINEELCDVLNQTPNYETCDRLHKEIEATLGIR